MSQIQHLEKLLVVRLACKVWLFLHVSLFEDYCQALYCNTLCTVLSG